MRGDWRINGVLMQRLHILEKLGLDSASFPWQWELGLLCSVQPEPGEAPARMSDGVGQAQLRPKTGH